MPQGYEDPAYDYQPMMAAGMYMAQEQIRPPVSTFPNLLRSYSIGDLQLNYHLYTAPSPHVANIAIAKQPLQSFFIPDDLSKSFLGRLEASNSVSSLPPPLPPPNELGVYHSLTPLESTKPNSSKAYGHPAPVYRAVSSVDGIQYVLRRIEGESAGSGIDCEADTPKAFGWGVKLLSRLWTLGDVSGIRI